MHYLTQFSPDPKSALRFITKIHLVAADVRMAIIFALSQGDHYDAPRGRPLLEYLGPKPEGISLLMDKAYEDIETWQLVLDLA